MSKKPEEKIDLFFIKSYTDNDGNKVIEICSVDKSYEPMYEFDLSAEKYFIRKAAGIHEWNKWKKRVETQNQFSGEKLDVLDFVIGVLTQHEKELDRISENFNEALRRLEKK